MATVPPLVCLEDLREIGSDLDSAAVGAGAAIAQAKSAGQPGLVPYLRSIAERVDLADAALVEAQRYLAGALTEPGFDAPGQESAHA